MPLIGVQSEGTSTAYVKRMAIAALEQAIGSARPQCVADIGGGGGELTRLLAPRVGEVWLVDFSPPEAARLPANVKTAQADFNQPWNLPDNQFDFTFSLECIEHVENPRHFMRELKRITKPSGHIFVTTPNNHSLSSKLTFLMRGEHRQFQAPFYPAHVSPLLKCDLERMSTDLGLRIVKWLYSNNDVLPGLAIPIYLPGPAFSMNFGVLLQKP